MSTKSFTMYKGNIDKAIKIFKEEGGTELYLLGALVEGRYNKSSDMSFAVKDCPKGKYDKTQT